MTQHSFLIKDAITIVVCSLNYWLAVYRSLNNNYDATPDPDDAKIEHKSICVYMHQHVLTLLASIPHNACIPATLTSASMFDKKKLCSYSWLNHYRAWHRVQQNFPNFPRWCSLLPTKSFAQSVIPSEWVIFLWTWRSMRWFNPFWVIVLFKHDFTCYRAEKEHPLVALVAGMTKINFTILITSDRSDCTWERSLRKSQIEENRTRFSAVANCAWGICTWDLKSVSSKSESYSCTFSSNHSSLILVPFAASRTRALSLEYTL